MHKVLKRSLVMVVCVLVLCYVVPKIYSLSCNGIKTEIALCDSVSDSINAKAFFVRKEVEIFNKSQGILNFIINDAEKVQKGGVIAQIYADEKSAVAQKKIKDLDEQIGMLQNFSSVAKAISTNPNHIEKQMHQTIKRFLSGLNSGDYSSAMKQRNQLLYLLNERRVIFGKVDDFSAKILDLKKEREFLSSGSNSKTGNIIATESGYFVGKTDGYENAIDYKNVISITPKEVEMLLNSGADNSGAVSKIVNFSQWYLVCNVSKDDAQKFNVDSFVDITLPFTDIDKIQAKVAAVNQASKSADASVVLKCNYINKDILALRKEDVKIDIATYNGLRINKKAIHENIVKKTVLTENGDKTVEEKNVQGVYVLKGKQLHFKEILLKYVGPNYAICEKIPGKDSLFSGESVNVYDEIVVGGSDLYDGKTVK